MACRNRGPTDEPRDQPRDPRICGRPCRARIAGLARITAWQAFGVAMALMRAERGALIAAVIVALTLTREQSPMPGQRTGRIDRGFVAEVLSRFGAERPRLSFVCGATAFVEVASMFLVEAGLPFASIRTERYGGIPAAELAETVVAPEV